VRDLDLAAPYGVAIILYLISPLLTGLVIFVVRASMNNGRVGLPDVDDAQIPYYLMPEVIEDYVEYATDAAQVIPVLLLPFVGAVYGFSGGVPAPESVTFLIAVFLVAIAMLAWMLKKSPSDYVSRKWHSYSILTLTGIALNLAGMTLALMLS
jgi:hypothetical protein